MKSLALAYDALKAAGRIDAGTYARRLAACEACPFYVTPPERAVYRLARRLSPDARICSKCGCFMKLKALLIKQRCPSDRW